MRFIVSVISVTHTTKFTILLLGLFAAFFTIHYYTEHHGCNANTPSIVLDCCLDFHPVHTLIHSSNESWSDNTTTSRKDCRNWWRGSWIVVGTCVYQEW